MSTTPPPELPSLAPGSVESGRSGHRDGLLGVVVPNSRAHWSLLIAGLGGAVAFNAVYLIDGALRHGYDSFSQPVSALSLGPGGAVQVVNFIAFGILGCVTAFAWRPTLAGGIGAVWYPRLALLAGLGMICSGIFTLDPGNGYPPGAVVPAHASVHAQVHNVASYISLTATVAGLIILARRFFREPDWRGWAPAALAAAVLMMIFLAMFGILIAHGGPGGIFEKLASLTPTVFGIALTCRLIARRDARITRPSRPSGMQLLADTATPGKAAGTR
jgi:Protein of unknown function (DUF998)